MSDALSDWSTGFQHRYTWNGYELEAALERHPWAPAPIASFPTPDHLPHDGGSPHCVLNIAGTPFCPAPHQHPSLQPKPIVAPRNHMMVCQHSQIPVDGSITMPNTGCGRVWGGQPGRCHDWCSSGRPENPNAPYSHWAIVTDASVPHCAPSIITQMMLGEASQHPPYLRPLHQGMILTKRQERRIGISNTDMTTDATRVTVQSVRDCETEASSSTEGRPAPRGPIIADGSNSSL